MPKSSTITLPEWLQEFQKNKINIAAIFYCPHGPHENCECRKPQIRMIEAAKMFEIDYEKFMAYRDKDSDIPTAYNAQIQTIQVSSGHLFDKENSKASYVVDSMKDVPNIIKK